MLNSLIPSFEPRGNETANIKGMCPDPDSTQSVKNLKKYKIKLIYLRTRCRTLFNMLLN